MNPSAFLLLKTLHILSATLLFGTGLGTAFHMFATHLRGDARAIAVAARNVVLADWLFTTPAGIAQPLTGIGLVLAEGFDPLSSWLIVTYALYVVAALCWVPVVILQLRIRDIAEAAVAGTGALPPEYHRAMRAWFWLGWPAFIGLLGVFWLMVAKPDLP